MNEPITLFTTDAIIEELRRRYPDGTVIAYEVPEDQVKSKGCSWCCHVQGNSNVLAKLSFVINHNVNEIIQLGTEDAEPEKVDYES